MSDTPLVPFVKGHGTGNDFVVLPNLDGSQEIPPGLIARVCDRRNGIGADGVLIVAPASMAPDDLPASNAQWFMDYRNADGSVAQMCGNGARVFARYLVEQGLERDAEFVILTRGGAREITVESDDNIRVEMGKGTGGDEPAPSVEVLGVECSADAWWIPNPHVAVFVDDVDALPTPLPEPVVISDRFPDGHNVEYVQDVTGSDSNATLHAKMRVHERGVGETSSCGTGACAASLAIRRRHNQDHEATTIVDVPGGRLWVHHHEDGQLDLIGPAVLVAQGHFDRTWWEGNDEGSIRS